MPPYNDVDTEIDEEDFKGSTVREQDRFLPIANISRIMKKALPANAKIAKDAKETVQFIHSHVERVTSVRGRKGRQLMGKIFYGQ